MINLLKPPADDLDDVRTEWGVLPRWKARALALGEIQAVVNEMRRNDALNSTPLHDEDKPPRLVADQQQRAPGIAPDLLAAIEAKIAELNERMDAYERVKRAHDALTALEDRIEAGLPPDDDDDGDLLLRHLGDDDRRLN
jgi:hypothetical protein